MIEKLIDKLPQSVLDELPLVMEKFGITNPLRLTHFLAQCSHESGGFKIIKENLNYSTDGLLRIFSKYFRKADGVTPDRQLAESYARQPQRIGSRVYANRMGNGNEASGDGYKYSGKGFIQLTGKDNYKQFSEFIREDCVANPDLVATKYPLSSAAFFFNKNHIWDICDKGGSRDVIVQVTKKVNGGDIGLQDRIIHFDEFNKTLA